MQFNVLLQMFDKLSIYRTTDLGEYELNGSKWKKKTLFPKQQNYQIYMSKHNPTVNFLHKDFPQVEPSVANV